MAPEKLQLRLRVFQGVAGPAGNSLGRQVAQPGPARHGPHLANGRPVNLQFLCFFMAYKKAITLPSFHPLADCNSTPRTLRPVVLSPQTFQFLFFHRNTPNMINLNFDLSGCRGINAINHLNFPLPEKPGLMKSLIGVPAIWPWLVAVLWSFGPLTDHWSPSALSQGRKEPVLTSLTRG